MGFLHSGRTGLFLGRWSGTGAETVLESPWHSFEVTAPASTRGSPAGCLEGPVVTAGLLVRVSARGASFLLVVEGAISAAAA